MPEVNSDLAQQLIKDPYCFDFARLTERYNEIELKDALVKNIENFLIELGNGFAYMGREYRIEIGNTEMFADMQNNVKQQNKKRAASRQPFFEL